MALFNAKKDKKETKPGVVVDPEGLQPGEQDEVDVHVAVENYDLASTKLYAAEPLEVAPGGELVVSPTDIHTTCDVTTTIRVNKNGNTGTLQATCSNEKITVQADDAQGTVTVTCPSGTDVTIEGDITITVGEKTATVHVILDPCDNIIITANPKGEHQFVNEEVILTVQGTTKPLKATCDQGSVSVSPMGGNKWKVVATAPVNGAVVKFNGTGVKEATISFNFVERVTLVVDIPAKFNPAFVGDVVPVTVTGGTVAKFSSSNPGMVLEEDAGSGAGHYNLTCNKTGMTELSFSPEANHGDTVTVKFIVSEKFDIKTDSESYVTQEGQTIKITVTNNPDTIQAVSDKPEQITCQVVGNVIYVNCLEHNTGVITISGRGINDKQVNVTFTDVILPPAGEVGEKSDFTYTVIPNPGYAFAGSDYIIKFNCQADGMEVTSSEPTCKITALGNGVFKVATDIKDGKTTKTTTINATATNFNAISFDLVYKTITDKKASVVTPEVSVEEEAIVEFVGLTAEPLNIDVSDTNVGYYVNSVPNGKTTIHFYVTDKQTPKEVTVNITGAGIAGTETFKIKFIPVGTIYINPNFEISGVPGTVFTHYVEVLNADGTKGTLENLKCSIVSGDPENIVFKKKVTSDGFTTSTKGSAGFQLELSKPGYRTILSNDIIFNNYKKFRVIGDFISKLYPNEVVEFEILTDENIKPNVSLKTKESAGKLVNIPGTNKYQFGWNAATTNEIQISYPGYKDYNIAVKVVDVPTITLTPRGAESVTIDEEIIYDITGLTGQDYVITNTKPNEVTVKNVVTPKQNFLIVRSSVPTTADINIEGREVKSTAKAVTFTAPAKGTVALTPNKTEFTVGDIITVEVSGLTDPYTLTCEGVSATQNLNVIPGAANQFTIKADVAGYFDIKIYGYKVEESSKRILISYPAQQ